MDKLPILMMCLFLVSGQDKQARIFLHMQSTIPNQIGGTKDMALSTGILKTVNSVFCHGPPGATFIIHIDPNSGNMDLVDNILNFDDATKGVKPCMPENDGVQCSSTHVCIPGSSCTVNVTIDCDQTQGPTKWERIPQVEVTFMDRHGELVLQSCYVMCLASDFTDESLDQGSEGLSYLAIGFIIAGTVLAGFFLVLGVVVWKIRNLNRFEPAPFNLHHHIHYIS